MEIEETWDDEWSDVEYYDDDAYDDDDDESETIACPACGADVYEDAERCSSCGEYIIASSSGSGSAYLWKGRPIWWIVLGALGITAMILSLVF